MRLTLFNQLEYIVMSKTFFRKKIVSYSFKCFLNEKMLARGAAVVTLCDESCK